MQVGESDEVGIVLWPAERTLRPTSQAAWPRGQDLAKELRSGTWRRQTYRLPRDEARQIAKEWFERYPKAAYLTQVESWTLTDEGLVEFTMRRLPTAD